MKIALILLSVLMLCLVAGCSDEDSDNGTEPVAEPDTPAGLAVTATDLMSLTLSWDTVSDADEYLLYRSDTEMGTYAEVYSGAAAGFIDNNVMYATSYWYKVSAENSGGESDLSAAVPGSTDVPYGFVISGSPSGAFDVPFTYLDQFNGKPQYQSNPIGLRIVCPSSGDQAGLWVFYDQIEGMNTFYHPTGSAYPPQTGWRYVYGDAVTSIFLTPTAP